MVSVLMTSYNREKYIRESIESVLSQTYSDYELIIVDDNSSDKTREIILEYSHISKVKYVFNSINLGEYLNRNKAASYAKGKYIKFLDSDDLMSKYCLENMVNQMEKYPNTAIGLLSYFDDKLYIRKEIMTPAELYKEFYFKGNLINCGPSSTIMLRDVFEQINGYRHEPYLSDTDFLFRITAQNNAVIFSKDLIFWRQHPEQEFNYGTISGEYKRKSYSYFLKYLEEQGNPMNFSDTNMAKRNLKNRYSRNIIKKLFGLDVVNAFAELRLYNLTYKDLVLSILPNKYPKEILLYR